MNPNSKLVTTRHELSLCETCNEAINDCSKDPKTCGKHETLLYVSHHGKTSEGTTKHKEKQAAAHTKIARLLRL